jgi:putative phage-type endonuclease
MISEIKYNTHEEWLGIRSKYIGGSDASAVIGLTPYASRYSLWAEKTGKVPPFEGNLTTKVGAYLEQFVADLFEEESGKKVRKKNSTIVNDLYPFACANVDRLVVGEKAFLEIKTTNSIPLMKKLRNSDEFPEQYYCQVVHYLAVTGLERAYLAVLINCRELKIYEMERDQAEIDALMGAEEEFWKLVETNTPPSPDGSEATSETITALYPNANDDTVDLFAYNDILRKYLDLTAQIKALTDCKEEVGNMVKAYMKEAGKGESDKFKVSFSNTTRKSFDAKRFSAENGNLDLTPYYNITNSRTFKVTEKGDK